MLGLYTSYQLGGSIETAAGVHNAMSILSSSFSFSHLQFRVETWLGMDDGNLVLLSPGRCWVAACGRGQQTFTVMINIWSPSRSRTALPRVCRLSGEPWSREGSCLGAGRGMCRGRGGGGAAGLGLPALALMSPVTWLSVTPGWVTRVRGRPPVRVGHLLWQLRTQEFNNRQCYEADIP